MRRPHPIVRSAAFAAPLLLLGYVMSFTSVVDRQAVWSLLMVAGLGLFLPGASLTTLGVVLTQSITQSPGLAGTVGLIVFLGLWVLISDIDRFLIGLIGLLTLIPYLTGGPALTGASVIPFFFLFVLVVARSQLVHQVGRALGQTTRPSRPGFLPEWSSRLEEVGWPCVGAIDDGKDKVGLVLHSDPQERSYAVVRHKRVWLISVFGDRYFSTTDATGGPSVPPELTQRIAKRPGIGDLVAVHEAGLGVLHPYCGDPDRIPADAVDVRLRRGHASDRRYILEHSWSVTARMYLEMITRPDRPLTTYPAESRISEWLAAPGQRPAADTVTG